MADDGLVPRRGKDLYDAVLLAERFALPRAVLEHTFRLADAGMPATAATLAGVRDVDWSNFLAEYRRADGGGRTGWPDSRRRWVRRSTTPAATPSDGNATDEIDPAWLTTAVLQLAEGIEVEHAYDRLPILADALQDAGCGNEDILDHCRRSGPHRRGCWVVDLVLGKA